MFDSIEQGKIFKIMEADNSLPNLLTETKLLKQKNKDIAASVLQGNTLSPYLFCVVLDFTMEKAILYIANEERLRFVPEPKKRKIVLPVPIIGLDFPDDNVLMF